MKNISFQLYSARDAGPLPDTLKMLADAGYRQVEGYGGILGDPAGLRDMLDKRGLSMTTCHIGLAEIESDPDTQIETARTLGIEAVFAPYLDAPDRPSDADGWRAFAVRLDEAGKPFRDAGISFGWHNHDFELVDLRGTTPLDLIAQGAPQTKLELDTGWVLRAGVDPLRLISDYGDQIIAAHIKDIAPDGENVDEDGWADVGHGTIDWRPILSALSNIGARLVLEHDNPSDATRFAKRSLASMTAY